MKEQTPITEYPVDLTRDEYVRSQELLSRRGGSAMGTRWISVAMLAVCVIVSIVNFIEFRAIDWSLVSLLLLLVVSEIWILIDLPKQLRRRSENAYDATVYGGYSFTGTVSVESDAVRKRTATATAVIPYEQCRLFLENRDMMIFCGADGKSIVIPARFLTEETAESTRKIALSQIPVMRQVLLQKVQPVAQPDAVQDMAAKSEDVLLTLDVDYTDSEIVSLAGEGAIQHFVRTLPNRMLLATMLSSVGFFMANIRPLPLFLLVMVILFLFSFITARIKMRRTITRTERDVCRIRIEFTDQSVRLLGKAQATRSLRIPWQYITRAVNCRDTVELHAGGDKQLTIPKRCIPDFDELSAVVDNHMN